MPLSSASCAGLLDDHRNAGVGVVHGDAAAHGPRADDGGLADIVGFGLFRNVRNLGDGSFAEEGVNQRFRLGRKQAFLEKFGFRDRSRPRNCREWRPRRLQSRPAEPSGRASFCRACSRATAKTVTFLAASCKFFAALAGLERQLAATASRANFTAPSSRSPSTILSRIPHARARSWRPTRLAERAHLHGFRDAGETRQPLRSTRAGNDAELHFRLTHLRRRDRDAIMAGHGDFQSAAERRAVDRHDHGLSRILNLQQHRIEGQPRPWCRR